MTQLNFFDATGLTAIATIILVLITGVYAYFTRQILVSNRDILAQMNKQAIMESRPYINIQAILDPIDLLLKLKITNIGKTAATNIRFELDRPFHQFADKNSDRNIQKFHLFNELIDTFPPGTNIILYLGTGPHIFSEGTDKSLTPNIFTIKTSYIGIENYTESFVVDLNIYRNSTSEHSVPLKRELESVRDSIIRISKSIELFKKPTDDIS